MMRKSKIFYTRVIDNAKLLLLLLCQIAPLGLSAQLKSQTQSIRGGDTIYKQQLAYKAPGRSGANVVWDFSRLKQEQPKYGLAYAVDTTMIGAIVRLEHATFYRYRQSQDSLLLVAMENRTTKMDFLRPRLLSLYGSDSIRDFCYQASGVYCDQARLRALGMLSCRKDATGIIILPEGDTLRNVYRLISTDLSVQTAVPLSRSQTIADSVVQLSDAAIRDSLMMSPEKSLTRMYRWYAPGYRYPVYECVEVFAYSGTIVPDMPTYATNFFYSPKEHRYLCRDEANWNILHPEDKPGTNPPDEGGADHGGGSSLPKEIYYNAFPNPVRTTMTLEIKSYERTTVIFSIFNSIGQLCQRSESIVVEGFISREIDCSALPMGDYVLSLQFPQGVKTHKFVKR